MISGVVHDMLDLLDDMPLDHDEASGIRASVGVLGQGQNHLLGATAVGALAEELVLVRIGAVTLGRALYLFIDATEEILVPS